MPIIFFGTTSEKLSLTAGFAANTHKRKKAKRNYFVRVRASARGAHRSTVHTMCITLCASVCVPVWMHSWNRVTAAGTWQKKKKHERNERKKKRTNFYYVFFTYSHCMRDALAHIHVRSCALRCKRPMLTMSSARNRCEGRDCINIRWLRQTMKNNIIYSNIKYYIRPGRTLRTRFMYIYSSRLLLVSLVSLLVTVVCVCVCVWSLAFGRRTHIQMALLTPTPYADCAVERARARECVCASSKMKI